MIAKYSKLAMALVLVFGLAIAGAAPVDAGEIKGFKVTPGSSSDPLSDYGLGISGVFAKGGVKVTDVEADSPAERIGLEVGDVLLTVNGIPANNPKNWIKALANQDSAQLRIRDVRNPYGPPVKRFVYLNQ